MEVAFNFLFVWFITTLFIFAILLLLLMIFKYSSFLIRVNGQKLGFVAVAYKFFRFSFGANLESKKSIFRVFMVSSGLALLVFAAAFFFKG